MPILERRPADPAGRPGSLSPRPDPIATRLAHVYLGPHTLSLITRHWAQGDERRCRRCPPGTCSAVGGVCTVTAARHVSEGEAPDYRHA